MIRGKISSEDWWLANNDVPVMKIFPSCGLMIFFFTLIIIYTRRSANPCNDGMINQFAFFFYIEQRKYPGDMVKVILQPMKIRKCKRRFDKAPQCPGKTVFFTLLFMSSEKRTVSILDIMTTQRIPMIEMNAMDCKAGCLAKIKTPNPAMVVTEDAAADGPRDDGPRRRPARPRRERRRVQARRLHQKPGTLTNDFFVNLLDMIRNGTAAGRWRLRGPRPEDQSGQVDRHPRRPDLRFALPAPRIRGVYGCAESKEK